METFLAVSRQTELAPNGSAQDRPQPASLVTEPHQDSDSVDSLREALHAAQLRIAYFERFGPWVEEQMAAVVERATSLERESERRRDETAEEIASVRGEVAEEVASARRESEHERKEINAEFVRRRHELEELKAECDRKREESAATIAHAHTTAEFVMGKLSESASGIVQRALSDFEMLRSGLTAEALAATDVTVPVPEPDSQEAPATDSSSDEQRRGWFRGRK